MDAGVVLTSFESYPARGTWMEMPLPGVPEIQNHVVPRTGYVDRNSMLTSYVVLAEHVVPRTGYVDRNATAALAAATPAASYPARGTWIEMQCAILDFPVR